MALQERRTFSAAGGESERPGTGTCLLARWIKIGRRWRRPRSHNFTMGLATQCLTEPWLRWVRPHLSLLFCSNCEGFATAARGVDERSQGLSISQTFFVCLSLSSYFPFPLFLPFERWVASYMEKTFECILIYITPKIDWGNEEEEGLGISRYTDPGRIYKEGKLSTWKLEDKHDTLPGDEGQKLDTDGKLDLRIIL